MLEAIRRVDGGTVCVFLDSNNRDQMSDEGLRVKGLTVLFKMENNVTS